MTLTTTMMTAGLSWPTVTRYVEDAIKLLQTVGPPAVDAVRGLLKAAEFVSGRNFVGAFAALSQVELDVEKVIAAIREVFPAAA